MRDPYLKASFLSVWKSVLRVGRIPRAVEGGGRHSRRNLLILEVGDSARNHVLDLAQCGIAAAVAVSFEKVRSATKSINQERGRIVFYGLWPPVPFRSVEGSAREALSKIEQFGPFSFSSGQNSKVRVCSWLGSEATDPC